MTNHPAKDVWADGVDVDKDSIALFFRSRVDIALVDADELRAMDTLAAKFLRVGPSLYQVDLLDSTSLDNFPAVIVSNDGYRYKPAEESDAIISVNGILPNTSGDLRLVEWAAWSVIASDATVDLGAATSNKVQIDGTTTITSFGAGTQKFRLVRFTGVLTLTHNGTSLVLPGAANITTAAGDMLLTVSGGAGNWRVLAYTRANGKSVIQHTAGEIPNTPAGNIVATNVQDAIAELDAEKAALAGAGFTGTVTISNVVPNLTLIETDATADNGRWDHLAESEQLQFRAVNDANNAASTWLAVNRTGITVDSIQLLGTVIDIDGNELVLDADGDTSLRADTDDEIDIKIAGVDRHAISTHGITIGGAPIGGRGFAIVDTEPITLWQQSDASTDNKNWEIEVFAEQFNMRLVNDAMSADTDFLIVDRTGMTVDSIQLLATVIDINGNELVLDADGDTSISAAVDDVISFKINGASELTLNGAALFPTTPSGLAIGAAANPFLSAHFADGGFVDFGNNEARLFNGTSNLQISIGGTSEYLWTASAFSPFANGGNTLGTNLVGFGGLHLSTGSDIIWANGEIELRQTADQLELVGGAFDLGGNSLVLDADGDTFLQAGTDDQINVTIAAAVDFRFVANSFQVLSGSNIDMGGGNIILDADNDTSIGANSDDQIDITIGGVLEASWTGAALAFAGDAGVVSGLASPTQDSHAANKGYVDALIEGLDRKESVRMATTANVALTGLQTIDTVVGAADDRVLVKNNTDASENGPYLMKSGAWVRTEDANSATDVHPGIFFYVEEGAVNGTNGFVLTTPLPITLDTTNLTFTQTSGAGQIVAGGGMTKTGNQLDVGAGAGITVNADDVQLDTSHIRNVDHSAIDMIAGLGLTGGGTIDANRTFNIGASDGITVGADSIEINHSFANVWLAVQTFNASVDLNGTNLVLDADGDTLIDSFVDDTIDIQIGGAVDFRLTANTLTALSGSTISVPSGAALDVSAGTLTLANDQISGDKISGGTIGGSVVLDGAIAATSLDLNGVELILDADADTSITADTDDQVDFRIGGTDLIRMLSEGLRMLSGTMEWSTEATVASATTTDLGAQVSNKVSITGTTTITGFGSGTNKMRVVRFNAALTLTHNGTSLILPGGANITTAAGDMALAISNGAGNWRVYFYTRASGKPVTSNDIGELGDVDLTGLADTNTILYDQASGLWKPGTGGGGGGGAPESAEYVTLSTNPELTAERVLTDSDNFYWDSATAAQVKLRQKKTRQHYYAAI